MALNCSHEFVVTKLDVDYGADAQPLYNSAHCVVVCLYCGQVRKVYSTGKVLVEKQEGEIQWTSTNG